MLATANATNLTGRIIIQIWQDVTFIVHTLKGHLSYANLCNLLVLDGVSVNSLKASQITTEMDMMMCHMMQVHRVVI